MSATTANRKMERLYGGLNERERVRMLAKLSREHDTREMDRLRDATPMEQADAYNRALKLLRTLAGNLPDWLTAFHMGMQRDRFLVQHANTELAHRMLTRLSIWRIWELIAYPVTESEYQGLVQLERAELCPIDDYVVQLIEGNRHHRHPALDEYLGQAPEQEAKNEDADWKPNYAGIFAYLGQERKPAEAEETSDWEATYSGIRAIIDDAIKKGELPKPKRKAGEPALPLGVLSDWSEGTTPETYKPQSPEWFVPALELLGGDFAKWEIHPDTEADTVKERRAQILDVLLQLAGTPPADRGAITSLDPLKTQAEIEAAKAHIGELAEAWYTAPRVTLAEIALEAATVHATHRAQLEGLIEALAIVQQEDFYGEDPLWPEIRAQLEATQEEAARLHEVWETVSSWSGLGTELRELQGLELYPKDSLTEPAPLPLPQEVPSTEELLGLIRSWSA